MKNIQKRFIIMFVALAMILPLSLASIFAEGEEFKYNLNYVLSEDKTYATITLELLPTEDVQYTLVTDGNGVEEKMDPVTEVKREYIVNENKEYRLKVNYIYQETEEKSQELKITVSDIQLPTVRNLDNNSITEGAYTIDENGSITYIDLTKLDDPLNITILEKIQNRTVKNIVGNLQNTTNVFNNENGYQSVQTITLPNTLTIISSYAFTGCSGLTNITLPDGLELIGESAFSNCQSLTSIKFPKTLKSLGVASSFSGCLSLSEVNLPEGLTELGGATFSRCSNLKKVILPKSVTSISYSVFSECTQLKTISITDKINSIGSYAFGGCSNLEEVLIMSDEKNYNSAMENLISTINNQIGTSVAKYLGNIELEINNSQIVNYGAKEYNLTDLITVASVVYKYEGNNKVISNDLTIPVEYTLSKKSRNNGTRLDVVNNKLYIDENEEGILTLTAMSSGKTASVDIETTPLLINSISIKTKPLQLEYRDGDIFNPEGLVISLVYNSGDTKDVSYQDEKGNFTFDMSKLKTGDKNVKITYQGKEATIRIEVVRQPILADANKNVIEGIKKNYIRGTTVSFQAKGDQQNNSAPVKGDTRYIPLHWKVNETGNFNKDGKATLLANSIGKQVLVVTFQLEEYDGSQWIHKGEDNKSVIFEVVKKENIKNPTLPNKPSKDKDVSFDFTTTKNGITYDANGNVVKVDKYGNIIQTGDNHYILLYAGVMLISGMVGYRIYKKRKVLK